MPSVSELLQMLCYHATHGVWMLVC